MAFTLSMLRLVSVAPVRERGLKCLRADNVEAVDSRSREGAWIEI